jgi:hypothetical protein
LGCSIIAILTALFFRFGTICIIILESLLFARKQSEIMGIFAQHPGPSQLIFLAHR